MIDLAWLGIKIIFSLFILGCAIAAVTYLIAFFISLFRPPAPSSDIDRWKNLDKRSALDDDVHSYC